MSPRHPPAAYRNLSDISENPNPNPFTPGTQFAVPQSQFAPQDTGFKLQAPPTKAPSATPKLNQSAFTPTDTSPPSPPTIPTVHVSEHGPVGFEEPTYEAVPIPGAYTGQAVKSPPPTQTSFGQSYY
jgi:hypothetical protein